MELNELRTTQLDTSSKNNPVVSAKGNRLHSGYEKHMVAMFSSTKRILKPTREIKTHNQHIKPRREIKCQT